MAAVRELNWLEFVGETMLYALGALTKVDPDGFGRWRLPSDECYSGRFISFRLPRSKQKRVALAETIDRDGWHLMSCI